MEVCYESEGHNVPTRAGTVAAVESRLNGDRHSRWRELRGAGVVAEKPAEPLAALEPCHLAES